MKKLFSVMLLLGGALVFADDFTWAVYEIECMREDAEPSHEKFIELCKSGQCYGDSPDEVEKLMRGAENGRNCEYDGNCKED